jgi:phospholipid transport system substrate-binding protein
MASLNPKRALGGAVRSTRHRCRGARAIIRRFCLRTAALATALALASPLVMPSDADAASDTEAFVEELNSQILTLIKDTRSSPEERKRRLQHLLEERFDLETMARLALGRYWRMATPAYREEYKALFSRLLLTAYAIRLESVREVIYVDNRKHVDRIFETLRFRVRASNTDHEHDSLLATTIEVAERPHYRIAYRVRLRNGQLKIINVTIQGVNLIITWRAEFAAIARREGLDGLLSLLGAKLTHQNAPTIQARSDRTTG